MTPAGIEPATFRFVAQHLNHCATAVPKTGHVSFQNTGLPNQNILRYQHFNEICLPILHFWLCSELSWISTMLVSFACYPNWSYLRSYELGVGTKLTLNVNLFFGTDINRGKKFQTSFESDTDVIAGISADEYYCRRWWYQQWVRHET